MTGDDKEVQASTGEGIEYRATIRFPKKDYEFMQKLIDDGEYTNVTEIVRDAVKRFRLEWKDMEAAQQYMPMRSMMSMNMMPRMRRMMQNMCENDNDREAKR
jgi:Arc/MetJ-type ribon-helix-helix transcriptional regulator